MDSAVVCICTGKLYLCIMKSCKIARPDILFFESLVELFYVSVLFGRVLPDKVVPHAKKL